MYHQRLSMTFILFSLIFTLSTLKFVRSQGSEYDFRIREEVPIETVVGSLAKGDSSFKSQGEQLNILNRDDEAVNCFKINAHGDLLVAKRIDRDTICQEGKYKSQGVLRRHCAITLQIGSSDMIISVTVYIEDINDNAPKWSEKSINLKLIDGIKERSKVALPQAHDIDFGNNAIIDYDIKEKKLPFRISTIDGLYLEILHSLDREEMEEYKFTLVAKDKGSPPLSSEIEVTVTIEDINDNTPTFTKSVYRFKTISEDSGIGTEIGKLEATDADSGQNGNFSFRFADSVPSSVKHLFAIQPDGKVIVKSLLDVDNGESQYKFKVTVEDLAQVPYSRSSDSTVIITVSDVNDEKPDLTVVFMKTDARSGQTFIEEDAKIGTMIGMLDVKDLDYGGKDTVTCQSDTANFILTQNDQSNKYRILTNSEFDREKSATTMLKLVCRDSGGNVGTSEKTIIVKDVNDNEPVFNKSVYLRKIRENQPPNTSLSEGVVATDPDSDSIIRYQIVPEYSANFSVHPETGNIQSRISFDRESCALYVIKVIATDALVGRIHTGTTTVSVMILDENDNSPVFSQDIYTFNIQENKKPNSIVGTVMATDRDSDDRNLKYRILPFGDTQNFVINQRTGTIKAMTGLDREQKSHYVFPVSVEDGNSPLSKIHSSTATVTVLVDDVNDNSPKFTVPSITSSNFDVSVKDPVGHKIITVKAEDRDSLDNALVTYSITYGNDPPIFSLDSVTGLLVLCESLTNNGNKARLNYILSIRACDSGKPNRQCSDFKNLRINVIDDSSYKVDRQPESDNLNKSNGMQHETIMICLAILFLILLLSSILLLIVMKRRALWWCRSSSRATSKDKRFEAGVNSQMLPTIDANVKDKDIQESMRSFATDNRSWLSQSDMLKYKQKYGYAVDHTNRSDYQILDGLCLATTVRPGMQQPRFIDPCSRFNTIQNFPQSNSFISDHNIKIVNTFSPDTIPDQPLFTDGVGNIYQSVEDEGQVNLYSKLTDNKKSSKYNLNDSNVNSSVFPSDSKSNTVSNLMADNRDKDLSKYSSFAYNEASFV